MRTVAIIQARMGSTRLPGKAMLPLVGDIPVLKVVIDRVLVAKERGWIDDVLVAGPREDDMSIADACLRWGIPYFRSACPPSDVLQRFVQATTVCAADRVVRVTADCPLVDPYLIGLMVSHREDYVTNAQIRTLPDGFDLEIISARLLARLHEDAPRADPRREHVAATFYPAFAPAGFTIAHVSATPSRADWRFTLDTPDDYAKLRALPWHGDPTSLLLSDIIAMVERGEVAAQ